METLACYRRACSHILDIGNQMPWHLDSVVATEKSELIVLFQNVKNYTRLFLFQPFITDNEKKN